MAQPALEVADIFRDHGSAWREANRGHVSLDQLKVMSAVERCRTAALGEHEEQKAAAPDEPRVLPCPCPNCGGRMIVIEIFARGRDPTYPATSAPTPVGIDTS